MGSSTFSFAHIIDAFRDMIEKMNTPNHKKVKKKKKKKCFVWLSVTLFGIMIGIVTVYCQNSNTVRMDRWH